MTGYHGLNSWSTHPQATPKVEPWCLGEPDEPPEPPRLPPSCEVPAEHRFESLVCCVAEVVGQMLYRALMGVLLSARVGVSD